MEIQPAAIIEYGLKAILLLLDIGFLLCFVLFQIAAWYQMKDNRKTAREGGKPWRHGSLFFFIVSVLSVLISIVLSGVILIGWWV